MEIPNPKLQSGHPKGWTPNSGGRSDGPEERFVVGLRIVWGVREPKLIVGAGEGKKRLRMRNTGPAKLFVRTDEGVRCFVLEDREHYWFVNPRLEQGRNVRYRYEPISTTDFTDKNGMTRMGTI